MKEQVIFRDKENNMFSGTIEITNGRLSISGNYKNSGGQCQENIKPKNKEQKRFLDIWEQYHLNKRELPITLEAEVLNLIKSFNKTEAERTFNKRVEDIILSDRAEALRLSLGLTIQEAEEDITDDEKNEQLVYCGTDYLVLTNEEARERCKEFLDKDMWIESIKADRTEENFINWQENTINIDGYGHLLNFYDGTQEEETINGITYYIIQN